MNVTFWSNQQDRIQALEEKLADLESILDEVKTEINEEIKRKMKQNQQKKERMRAAKPMVENDILVSKRERIRKVSEDLFSTSINF